jgi:hypothetical protein
VATSSVTYFINVAYLAESLALVVQCRHLPFMSSNLVRIRNVCCCDCSCGCSCRGVDGAWGVGGCGVAGEGTGTPQLEFELEVATVTVAVAHVAVLPTVWVWAAGDDATAITPDSDVAAAVLPVLTESELTDSGFCAAGRMICGYCGKGSIVPPACNFNSPTCS